MTIDKTTEELFTDGFYEDRKCSICNSAIGYVIKQGEPYFDCHCECMVYRINPPEPRSREEFKEFLKHKNQQEAAHANDIGEVYLIWSNEHNSWWRTNSEGYTADIQFAGEYSKEDALSICNGANYDWNVDSLRKIPNELPILKSIALKLTYNKS